MTSKCATAVADCLSVFVMMTDISDIIQCDNEREFLEATLLLMKRHDIKVINDRLRTSRTQSLVKQSNHVLKDKLHK